MKGIINILGNKIKEAYEKLGKDAEAFQIRAYLLDITNVERKYIRAIYDAIAFGYYKELEELCRSDEGLDWIDLRTMIDRMHNETGLDINVCEVAINSLIISMGKKVKGKGKGEEKEEDTLTESITANVGIATGFLKLKIHDERLKGSKVFIDGREMGEIEGDIYAIELPTGRHKIEVKSEKVGDIVMDVDIEEFGEKEIDLKVVDTYGIVKIKTTPAGAKVYIDGKYTGETPRYERLTVGIEYSAQIEKEGFESIEDVYFIKKKGEILEKNYKLKKLPIPAGNLKWKFETGSLIDSSPAIGRDGTVYVGSWDNYLYAIRSSSFGLADSPWPMFRHDVMHTGRVDQEL